MPLVPLVDLIPQPSTAEVKATLLALLTTLGFPVTSWEVDGVALQLIDDFAASLSAQAQVQAAIASGGFLDLAAGLRNADGTDDPRWITLLAVYLYGIDATTFDAGFATGPVTLTNPSASPFPFAAGDFTFANAAGYTYRNTGSGTVPGSGSLSGVTILADQPGTTGSASTATIALSSGQALTASNPAPIIGTAPWSNAQIAAACRAKLASLSPNGAAGAYAYFAPLATDHTTGLSLGVTRIGRVAASGSGTVTIYAATASGPLGGSVAPPATTGACYELWLYLMGKCVPDSTALVVAPVTTTSIVVTGTVYVSDPNVVEADVLDAIAAYFASVPVGGVVLSGSGVVPVSGIVGAALGVVGVVAIDVVAPAGDVALAGSAIPVLDGASVLVVTAVP